VDEANALAAAVALLRQLTPDQREVVALRVIVGMTVRETAMVVDKSEGAVRVLCHRGLRTMAERIEAEQAARGALA
jgi:RNA polymerase sigma-70 factor (ECF subfamily)